MPIHDAPIWSDLDDVRARLTATGYVTSDTIASVTYLADRLGKPVACVRCRDTGLIEFVGGEHLTLAADGRLGSRKVTATPDKPIYKRCGCLDQRPAGPPAARRSFSADG